MRTVKIIFLIAIMGAAASKKLTGSEAGQHFWSLVGPAVASYNVKAGFDREAQKECQRYTTKANNEHIIDIGFYAADGVFRLKFFYAKKNDVEKVLKSYDDEQMRIQSKAFGEFVQKMVTVDDNEGRNIYFNMIEDIKDALLALGDGKRMKFVESVKDEIVRLELFFDETLLGIFQVTSVEKQGDKINNHFFLVVKFTISKNQVETTEVVEIPVLTNDRSIFESQMKLITSKLVINEFINCNDDNINQFNKFAKSSFGALITVVPDVAGSTQTLKKFALKAPEETADGRIVYVPPKSDAEVGSYEIIVELNGAEMVKKSFKRMSNADYHKFLQSLDLKGIFLSLWEKVHRIFEKKALEVFNENNKVPQFDRSKKIGHMFEKDELTDQVIYDGSNLMTLIFQERSDNALVSIKTDYQSFNVVRLTFVRKAFNPEMLGLYFEGVFAMLKQAIAKNIAVKKSGSKIGRV